MNFSVLLSLYNKEQATHLTECLQSIDEQSLKADEIVIVFDGPVNQELSDVVARWCEILPIKILALPYNVGLGQALNQGLEICQNEIIFRMDTDDICVKDRFMTQISKLANDDALMLIGGHIDEYDETFSVHLGKRVVPTDFDAIKKTAKFKNPFNHMTVAFRKIAVLSVGGYQHHAFMEDYNLWLRMIAAGFKVENIDAVLVKARAGTSMLLRRRGFEYIKSEVLLFKLKRKLRLQFLPLNVLTLILRTIPRVFPPSLLRSFYKLLRK